MVNPLDKIIITLNPESDYVVSAQFQSVNRLVFVHQKNTPLPNNVVNLELTRPLEIRVGSGQGAVLDLRVNGENLELRELHSQSNFDARLSATTEQVLEVVRKGDKENLEEPVFTVSSLRRIVISSRQK